MGVICFLLISKLYLFSGKPPTVSRTSNLHQTNIYYNLQTINFLTAISLDITGILKILQHCRHQHYNTNKKKEMVKYCQQSFDTLFLWEFNFVNGDYFVFLFSKNKLLGLVRTGFSHCKTAYYLFEDFTE